MNAIEIIMIPVSNRRQARDFYTKLGFEVILEATDPHGEPWIQMGLPGSNTTISLAGFYGIICKTDDIVHKVDVLKAKGVTVGNIDTTPWGRFAWLKDEDGNNVCLHQP